MSTDTWNKLAKRNDYPPVGHLGNRYRDETVAFLAAHNHPVLAPALKDEYTSSLTEHIEQVCVLITEKDLDEVILVGHSYGGMVITGVAAKMRDRIRRLVYLDAALPDPGQSLYDEMSWVYLPPPTVSRVAGSGCAICGKKLQFDAAKIQALPKTYILCTN